jgi:hypothetical protein
MKKAYELSTLTGTQVLLLVVSETGLVYTFTTAKLQPLVTKAEGKNLIQVSGLEPKSLWLTVQGVLERSRRLGSGRPANDRSCSCHFSRQERQRSRYPAAQAHSSRYRSTRRFGSVGSRTAPEPSATTGRFCVACDRHRSCGKTTKENAEWKGQESARSCRRRSGPTATYA